MLSTEQAAAIREAALTHLAKNADVLAAKYPGILIQPTEGKLIKLSIPMPDGTYTTIQRGESVLFEDGETLKLVAEQERPWNNAQAARIRHDVLVEFLLSR